MVEIDLCFLLFLKLNILIMNMFVNKFFKFFYFVFLIATSIL